MSSILLAVADALVVDLGLYAFGVPFEAVRSYADPAYELAAADTDLHCDVIPASELKTELGATGEIRYLASAHLVFRKKFAFTDIERVSEGETRVKKTAVDPLVALVEAVNERLTRISRPSTYTDAAWKETNIAAAVVHKHLRDWSQFTGIIKTTYAVPKALPT